MKNSPRYNERAWAIDIISEINSYCSSKTRPIHRLVSVTNKGNKITEYEIQTRGYHKNEKTPLGQHIDFLQEQINRECDCDITKSQVEKLLEHFIIILK